MQKRRRLCRRYLRLGIDVVTNIRFQADGVAVFSQSEMDCTSMHAKLTLELVDMIVRNLDSNPSEIIAYLNEIGQCHRNLKSEGMTVSMWDDFGKQLAIASRAYLTPSSMLFILRLPSISGDAILMGVRRNDFVRKHKELRRAWLAVIAFITDNIKQGQASFRASPSVEISEIRIQ